MMKYFPMRIRGVRGHNLMPLKGVTGSGERPPEGAVKQASKGGAETTMEVNEERSEGFT